MATLELKTHPIQHYDTRVEYRAYVKNLKPNEYVDYYFSVSDPTKIKEILKHENSSKYVFNISNTENIRITCLALVYTYTANMEKNILEALTEYKYLYDTLPTSLLFSNIVFWKPKDHMFELPYYYPIIAKVEGGVTPYEYTWTVQRIDITDQLEKNKPVLFYMSNLCNAVFFEEGIYNVTVTIKDKLDNSITDSTIVDVTSAVLDMQPDVILINQITKWTEPKDITIKSNNYYTCKYPLLFTNTEDIDLSSILTQLNILINNQISPKQMWERFYIGKGINYYALESKVAVYKLGKFSVDNLYFDNDGYLNCNVRISSDYSSNIVNARILQALRWVLLINNIQPDVTDVDFKYNYGLLSYSDDVLDSIMNYIDTNINTRYSKLEIDDIFDSVQTDVDVFLGKPNTYEYHPKNNLPFF